CATPACRRMLVADSNLPSCDVLLAFVASRVESNSKTLGNCLNVRPFAGGLPAFPRPIAYPS
ncbi:hypothetical protein BC831DRAFT_449221, partial [Entophlyctis helioformis]